MKDDRGKISLMIRKIYYSVNEKYFQKEMTARSILIALYNKLRLIDRIFIVFANLRSI